MRQARDLFLALTFCLLVTLPLPSVKAQTQSCDPLSSLRTTSVTCLAAGCTPTPPGTVAMVVVTQTFVTGTCAIDNNLVVTLTGGAVACTATVTSCEGGTVITLTDSDSDSVESADSSAESTASVDSSAESAAGSDSSASGSNSK